MMRYTPYIPLLKSKDTCFELSKAKMNRYFNAQLRGSRFLLEYWNFLYEQRMY